jgi:hypothetical protein
MYADEIIEALARRADSFLTDIDKKVVTEAWLQQIKSLSAVLAVSKTKLDAIALKPISERGAALVAMGIPDTDRKCLEILEVARKARNVTDAHQYINKSVASVVSSDALPYVDTRAKACNIVEVINGLKMSDGSEIVDVYGVAYGHMMPIFKKEYGDRMKTFDVDHVKCQKYGFLEGNIFTCKPSGILIDDTDTFNKVKERTKVGAAVVGDYGDLAKLEHVCGLDVKPRIAIMKVSVAVMVENIDRVRKILYPNMIIEKGKIVSEGVKPYAYARLIKCGKLHNYEAYMVLTNGVPTRRLNTNYAQLVGDITAISQCIAVVNKRIQMYDVKGLRMNDVKIKLRDYWLSLIKALPVRWPWYETKVSWEGGALETTGANFNQYGMDADYEEPEAVVDNVAKVN